MKNLLKKEKLKKMMMALDFNLKHIKLIYFMCFFIVSENHGFDPWFKRG